MRRAVFLDRDGVVNEPVIRNGKPYPPPSVGELRLVAGAEPALRRLHEQGFLLLILTNQPDVRRGTTTREAVERIHDEIRSGLPVDDIFACYHDDEDGCACRKPRPGLFEQAALKYDVDIAMSYFVGDRWRDVEAGHAAGCRTVLIDYGYDEQKPAREPAARVRSLSGAVEWILQQEKAL